MGRGNYCVIDRMFYTCPISIQIRVGVICGQDSFLFRGEIYMNVEVNNKVIGYVEPMQIDKQYPAYCAGVYVGSFDSPSEAITAIMIANNRLGQAS